MDQSSSTRQKKKRAVLWLTLKHTLLSVGFDSLSWDVTTSVKGPGTEKESRFSIVHPYSVQAPSLPCSNPMCGVQRKKILMIAISLCIIYFEAFVSHLKFGMALLHGKAINLACCCYQFNLPCDLGEVITGTRYYREIQTFNSTPTPLPLTFYCSTLAGKLDCATHHITSYLSWRSHSQRYPLLPTPSSHTSISTLGMALYFHPEGSYTVSYSSSL